MIALAMLAGTFLFFWTTYTRSQKGEAAQYRIDLREDLSKYEKRLDLCQDKLNQDRLSIANLVSERNICQANLKTALKEIERLTGNRPGEREGET